MPIDDLRRDFFPALSADAIETSLRDDSYNCIAWVAGDTARKWWPTQFPTFGAYWPIAPDYSVSGFIAAFGTLGFEVCENGTVEEESEKVVLYVGTNGKPTHMARQLPSGRWTSKLGDEEDIEHTTPEDLCGIAYGRVEIFMKRPIRREEP